MKRDMDFFRKLLLKLESLDYDMHDQEDIFMSMFNNGECETSQKFDLHYNLLKQASYIVETNGFFEQLSLQGYEFLDTIRDNEIWQKTNEVTNKAGGFTLEILKDLAKGFLKTKIKEHTGMEI